MTGETNKPVFFSSQYKCTAKKDGSEKPFPESIFLSASLETFLQTCNKHEIVDSFIVGRKDLERCRYFLNEYTASQELDYILVSVFCIKSHLYLQIRIKIGSISASAVLQLNEDEVGRLFVAFFSLLFFAVYR